MKNETAYLLVNLGTPQSPEPKDVKKYLAEFLMDPCVIDIPKVARWALVNGIIVNTRSKKSSHAYKQIWTDRGSPLKFHMEDLTAKVNKILPHTYFAMRYAEPSIRSVLGKLQNYSKIKVLPMYPQFAFSSSVSSMEKIKEEAGYLGIGDRIEFIPSFYNHPSYQKALSTLLERQIKDFKPDYLLFSYHGIPERQLEKAVPGKSQQSQATYCLKKNDCCETPHEFHKFCYRHQCFETTKGLAQSLKLKPGSYGISFQSRLGRTPWLQPFTDFEIPKLAQNKEIKKLAVVCPSFVSDCLETLEEIGMRAKSDFEKLSPGSELRLMTCLNSEDIWAEALKEILIKP